MMSRTTDWRRAGRTPPNPLGAATRFAASRMHDLRLQQHLTLEMMEARAARLGGRLPWRVLSAIHRGRRRVDVEDLVMIARVLDVDPGELVLGCQSRPHEPAVPIAELERLIAKSRSGGRG